MSPRAIQEYIRPAAPALLSFTPETVAVLERFGLRKQSVEKLQELAGAYLTFRKHSKAQLSPAKQKKLLTDCENAARRLIAALKEENEECCFLQDALEIPCNMVVLPVALGRELNSPAVHFRDDLKLLAMGLERVRKQMSKHRKQSAPKTGRPPDSSLRLLALGVLCVLEGAIPSFSATSAENSVFVTVLRAVSCEINDRLAEPKPVP